RPGRHPACVDAILGSGTTAFWSAPRNARQVEIKGDRPRISNKAARSASARRRKRQDPCPCSSLCKSCTHAHNLFEELPAGRAEALRAITRRTAMLDRISIRSLALAAALMATIGGGGRGGAALPAEKTKYPD